MPTDTIAKITEDRVDQVAQHAWVSMADMQIAPAAQRELRNEWVNHLSMNFNPDELGTITLSYRDGAYYIIDGQHRVEALRLRGEGDKQLYCVVYEGLSVPREAEMFLALNNRLSVRAQDKFSVSVTAGRPDEVAITGILDEIGLKVGQHRTGGALSCVGTLKKIYIKFGDDVLRRALTIVKDGIGDDGLTTVVIDGMALFVARYGDTIDDAVITETLRGVNAGLRGLMNKAEGLRNMYGGTKSSAVAGAIVEYANAGRGGKKLPRWWSVEGAQLRSA